MGFIYPVISGGWMSHKECPYETPPYFRQGIDIYVCTYEWRIWNMPVFNTAPNTGKLI